MKEILLKYGWNDTGLCKVCHGNAWSYGKSIDGRYYVVKVFISNTRTGIIERGHGNLYLSNSKRVPVNINTLEDVLSQYGLK